MSDKEYKFPTCGLDVTDSEGNFKSNFKENTIGYMKELIVWVKDHPNFSEEQRAYLMQEFEKPIIRQLKSLKIGYEPRYQKRLSKPSGIFPSEK